MTRENAEALVLRAPRDLVLRQFQLPSVTEDDAVLRVEACGLCGSDYQAYAGELADYSCIGCIPGHETIGVIESIGARAAELWGVCEGDRVSVLPKRSCGKCPPCAAENYFACEVYSGEDMVFGYVSADREPGLYGGYSTHHYLPPGSMLLPVPPGLDLIEATFHNPLAGALTWVSGVGAVQPGEVVAILGPGPRGLSGVIAAKEARAGFIAVTGHGTADAERLQWARRLGADLTVDVSESDPVEALHAATGGLADLVVDLTSRAPSAFMDALHLARRGGRIVVAGLHGGGEVRGFQPDLIVTKNLKIEGREGGVSRAARRAALDLLATGRYPVGELPHVVTNLDGVARLFDLMLAPSGDKPMHALVDPRPASSKAG
jgi:alcohol dehydrogenase